MNNSAKIKDELEKEKLSKLFLSFLRLGLTAFGGPAMVVYIKELAVKKNRWLSGESFQNGVGVCQSIPGATAMQVAAYVGLRAKGVWGAFAAYVGFGLPAFVLMFVMTVLYSKTNNISEVVSVFKGLNVIVVALVANAALNFAKTTIKKWQDILLCLGAAVFLILHGSPIIAIIVSAILAVFLYPNLKFKKIEKSINIKGNLLKTLIIPLSLILLLIAGVLILLFANHNLFVLSTLMIKIDLFAFGGGYASVPLMLHEIVDVKHWMISKTFMDGIALGQVTPGPIVITATFVGYLIAGFLGALIGTIAVFSPSFIILVAIIPYFDSLQHNMYFQRGLRGALVSFVGLLLAVTIQFAMAIHWNIYQILIAIIAFIALRLKIDILWVVLLGALISAFLL